MPQASTAPPSDDCGTYYAKYNGFDGVFASSKSFKAGLAGLVGPPPPEDAQRLILR